MLIVICEIHQFHLQFSHGVVLLRSLESLVNFTEHFGVTLLPKQFCKNYRQIKTL